MGRKGETISVCLTMDIRLNKCRGGRFIGRREMEKWRKGLKREGEWSAVQIKISRVGCEFYSHFIPSAITRIQRSPATPTRVRTRYSVPGWANERERQRERKTERETERGKERERERERGRESVREREKGCEDSEKPNKRQLPTHFTITYLFLNHSHAFSS